MVTDDGRYLLDEAAEGDLVADVAASPERVFVLLWAPDQEIGAFDADIVDELSARLTDAIAPERAVLFVWQGPQDGYVEELGGDGYLGDYGGPQDFLGDPAVTLPKAVAATADIDWYDDREDDGDNDYWGGWGGGGFLGLLIAGFVVLTMRSGTFLLRLIGGPRLPGGWRRRPATKARR